MIPKLSTRESLEQKLKALKNELIEHNRYAYSLAQITDPGDYFEMVPHLAAIKKGIIVEIAAAEYKLSLMNVKTDIDNTVKPAITI